MLAAASALQRLAQRVSGAAGGERAGDEPPGGEELPRPPHLADAPEHWLRMVAEHAPGLLRDPAEPEGPVAIARSWPLERASAPRVRGGTPDGGSPAPQIGSPPPGDLGRRVEAPRRPTAEPGLAGRVAVTRRPAGIVRARPVGSRAGEDAAGSVGAVNSAGSADVDGTAARAGDHIRVPLPRPRTDDARHRAAVAPPQVQKLRSPDVPRLPLPAPPWPVAAASPEAAQRAQPAPYPHLPPYEVPARPGHTAARSREHPAAQVRPPAAPMNWDLPAAPPPGTLAPAPSRWPELPPSAPAGTARVRHRLDDWRAELVRIQEVG